ncbi:MAG: DUF1156 domain-containing protein, partial [Candidatus Kariarchaeaceae archaeon]
MVKAPSKTTKTSISLLEQTIPVKLLSEKGAQERYQRKGHINAIKTWWARRPLISARGLIYASLVVNDRTPEKNIQQIALLEQIIEKLH